ncbi:hypothetical protein Tco_0666191, partial [Tanacetum coccineum]
MGCLPRSACLRSLCLTRPEFIGPWGKSGDPGLPIVDSSIVPYGKTWVTVNGPLQRVLSLPEKIFNLELKRRTRSPTSKSFHRHAHEVHLAQPRRNQSVVRQPTAFKSERLRFLKQQFASQVDVNNDLSKPVTTHYLPKEREYAVVKPHHMIAPGS